MSDKKKYVVTAITLGVIAAGSAALIGVTNLVTRDQIATNERNRFNAGIVSIFGENTSANSFNNGSFKKDGITLESYLVHNQQEAEIGWAIKTTGSNAYGKVSMLIGFDYSSKQRVGTYVIVNEQSYASTLEDNYITPLNQGDRDLDDVKCGATYGATLVKNMIDVAQEYVDGIIYE